MSSNAIPFLDLVTPHVELKDELTEIFRKALDTAGFIGGPLVQGFEADFARYCDTQHAIGVGSGTDALRFIFLAMDIQPGEIIITVPNTFIATTEAISQAGARIVFVDIDEATYNLDPAKLREYIETQCDFDAASRTLIERKSKARVRAVVPVHLYGQMADMDAILEIAEKYGLDIVEDACQAHGAEYYSKKEQRWLKAGSVGKAAAFSFYPGKNLGACGEAGAITTNSADIAQKVRMLRDHGQSKKYYHEIEGYNGRLDSIQAGILGVKLKHLPAWTEQRRQAAARYGAMLDAAGLALAPHQPEWTRPVYHLFVVRVDNRDEFMQYMNSVNIATGIHYPIPLHLQNAYRTLGYKTGDFPVTERVSAEIVSLPMFPQLQESQQSRVVSELANYCAVKSAA